MLGWVTAQYHVRISRRNKKYGLLTVHDSALKPPGIEE